MMRNTMNNLLKHEKVEGKVGYATYTVLEKIKVQAG